MKFYLLCITLFSIVGTNRAATCGCKILRNCYESMLEALQDKDETKCIEDAAIGTGTIIVYLKALTQYCGHLINVTSQHLTYDARNLYEVVITSTQEEDNIAEPKPTVIIDAGQEGGHTSVGFALYLIEQLLACVENKEMIRKVKWVILPCTNPDGMEYANFKNFQWKKNCRLADDELSFGVDITRNFDSHWSASDCPKDGSGFSQNFRGVAPSSENETIFIKDVIAKYAKDTKIYLSLKRNGHSIGYPYAYTTGIPKTYEYLLAVAGEVANKVNQRSAGVHQFMNKTIHDLEGKPHCGHSVDYAFEAGIPLSFEMRMFLEADNEIISKFQPLPRGYDLSLRNGYTSAIKELYNAITNSKKYGKFQ